MSVSINWETKVITVPRADMTLVQTDPFEVRELNINWFRLQLKDLEDGPEGMIFPDTHRHNTQVLLGGITYARVVEIINGYTVTFEDGQYAVSLVGANSNIGDVLNLNSVSVRSQNSAGLIASQDSEVLAELEPKVTEMHKLQGLVAAAPLTVSGSARTAGDISQTIVENPDGSVVVTRV